MRPVFLLPLLCALLMAAGGAAAQSREGEWLSYRDAYRAMVVFEKYGKAKNLIQHHLQVAPREKGVSTEGVQLALSGKAVQVNLALDATGRTVFPLLKAAYDENAELVLNRNLSQYLLRPRVSIVVRPDGVYEAAELRSACEQSLNFQRYVDPAFRARKCVGVRFAFAHKAGASVRLRRADGETVLPAQDGAPFADDVQDRFRVVVLRFADGDKGQVVTQNAPLAISAVYD
ncbi:MAG: hypothetical protein V4508_14815 [Pseudomonadota bacterium]